MKRMTVYATVIGLLGLTTAMLTALAPHPPAGLLLFGLGGMGLGMLAAVIGAAATLRLGHQPSR